MNRKSVKQSKTNLYFTFIMKLCTLSVSSQPASWGNRNDPAETDWKPTWFRSISATFMSNRESPDSVLCRQRDKTSPQIILDPWEEKEIYTVSVKGTWAVYRWIYSTILILCKITLAYFIITDSYSDIMDWALFLYQMFKMFSPVPYAIECNHYMKI